MAYNKELDDRIRAIVKPWPKTVAKKMFGGVGYLQRGNMVCGVHKDLLILRLGPDGARKALQTPHVKPFDVTGRPMKGWVMVARQGYGDDSALDAWLEKARDFVKTLPPK